MSRILTLNTVGKQLDIYLQENGKLLNKINILEDNRQAELLVLKVEEVLASQNLTHKDLDALAVVVGPGSFMGLKTSIAFAKAMNASIGTKLIALNLFEIMGYGENYDRIVLMADGNNCYQMSKNKEYSYQAIQELALENGEKVLTNIDTLKNSFPTAQIAIGNYSYDKIVALSYAKYQSGTTNNKIEALYIKPPRVNKRNKQL